MSQPTVTPMATSTVYPAQPTATSQPTSQTDLTSAPKSSLLFFVALGFAIVFTNLWIIIGVKYYFRYRSARRRGVPMNGVALGALAGGGERRRRRREKKLMSAEEVEEKFPLQTYKTWRAAREAAGLSTAGGVEAIDEVEAQQAREALGSAPAPSIKGASSRPTSVGAAAQDSDTVYEVGAQQGGEITAAGRSSPDSTIVTESKQPAQPTEIERTDTRNSLEHVTTVHVDQSKSASTVVPPTGTDQSPPQTSLSVPRRRDTADDDDRSDDEEEEEEPVVDDQATQNHLPDDIGSGDTCAICIDTLEDDDQVRGLHCGHAFHHTCVDVWLTTRRAICPLCKRDYYVRRPRDPNAPPAEDGGDQQHDQVAETREERRERRRRRREAREAERRAVEEMQASGQVNAVLPEDDDDGDRLPTTGGRGRGRGILARFRIGRNRRQQQQRQNDDDLEAGRRPIDRHQPTPIMGGITSG